MLAEKRGSAVVVTVVVTGSVVVVLVVEVVVVEVVVLVVVVVVDVVEVVDVVVGVADVVVVGALLIKSMVKLFFETLLFRSVASISYVPSLVMGRFTPVQLGKTVLPTLIVQSSSVVIFTVTGLPGL